MPRRILFIAYDGLQLLDLAGPAMAFETANRLSGQALYEMRTLSPAGGAIACDGGFEIQSEALANYQPGPRDTVLVMGAEAKPLRRAMANRAIRDWLRNAAGKAERIGSVCTGTFLLAAAGLLDGRQATTHWAGCDPLAKSFPRVAVNPDALYVIDANFWTSAGVTTGVDMALAMVKADAGSALMGQVAKRMVVYAHRPGRQSQFSEVLAAQTADRGGFSELIAWIHAHLGDPLAVPDLAARAGMSERSFQRKFTATIGVSPAKYVEKARIEQAKQLLEAGLLVKETANRVGFRSEASFRAAFHAAYGLNPALHRLVHSGKSDK